MSRQSFVEQLWNVDADATAVANTTTETIIFPNQTIPANYMQYGRGLDFRAIGKLSTTGTPTIQFGLRWGGVAGTLLAQTETITNASGISNVMWWIDGSIQVRTNGSSGVLLALMQVVVATSAAGTVASATGESLVTFGTAGGKAAPAGVTVDLTVDTALSLTAKWSAASASDTLTGMFYRGLSQN